MPKPLKTLLRPVRQIYYFVVDNVELLSRRVLGGRNDLTPPSRMIRAVGRSDYETTGKEFLNYFVTLADLKPDENVLDVGCGNGRMAVPLTEYLMTGVTYDGFDIVAEGINWCRRRITGKYPAFHFQLADVFNPIYNPRGQFRASEFKFPYRGWDF